MAKISLWNHGKRGNDYRFIDRHISEFINASGTALFVYLYQGSYDADGNPSELTELQDIVFQENRDRRYSKEIYEMRGTYNVADTDFDLRQFGFFMGADTIFMELHINDMVSLCGRTIMAGDVIELPHEREDYIQDGGEVSNKFFVVEDASRASSGYSSTWYPHLWRIKLGPMTGSQEYDDILSRNRQDPFGLDDGDRTLEEVMTTLLTELDVNERTVEEAEKWVKERNFETTQFYFVPEDVLCDQLPWIWAGDGEPPNGGVLLDSGDIFPENAPDGSYFLKTSFSPHQLYLKTNSRWVLQEVDYRMGKWTAAHRILDGFVNNDNITLLDDGQEFKEKIALSRALPPPEDF